MKFTDGYWQLRPGVSVAAPRQASTSVEPDERGFTVFAPTGRSPAAATPSTGRWSRSAFSSPLPDVIGVTIAHHAGGLPQRARSSRSRAEPTTHPVTVDVTEDRATLTSGALTARVAPGGRGASTSCRGDRLLTASRTERSIGIVTDARRHATTCTSSSRLGVGETVYGLGERFGPFVKNGQTVDIWNADGGTSSEQAYKNVPFYLTDRGYGVFVNHPGHGLVRGRLGGRVAGAVQRRRASRSSTSSSTARRPKEILAQVHRADRPPGAAARLVVRAVAVARRSPPTTTRRP